MPWIDAFGLDVKLGLRMLRKSWGLTLVGGLAMTVVIGIAAGVFSFLRTTFGSTVPLDEGDGVVAPGRGGEPPAQSLRRAGVHHRDDPVGFPDLCAAHRGRGLRIEPTEVLREG